MPKKATQLIFLVIAIAWIIGMAMAYFHHIPLGKGGVLLPEAGAGLASIFRHVVLQYILLFLILLSAWVVGEKLCSALKADFNGPLEETIFSLALGLVALSTAVMFLGFIHLLYRPVLWVLTVLPFALWWPTALDRYRNASRAWRETRLTSVQLVLLLVAVICVLLVTLYPLYPPVSLDAVNAYLTMAKGYLNAGWFELDPYIKYSMAPNNHTLLFTLAMGLGDEVTSVLTHFAVWVIVMAAIAAFGSRYLSTTGGLAGAVAFALIPVTTVTATWGNAENFTALYAMMSFWAIWRFVQSRSKPDAVLTGVFLGFALGTKIFMGMFWFWLLLVAAIYLIYKNGKFPVKNFSVIVIVSLALFLPWLVRNTVYFGNPVFPYMNKAFGHFGGIYQKYETDLQSDVHAGLENFSPGANKVTLFSLPREMTFWPNWGSKPKATTEYRFAERKEHGIGPLFIALLPLLLFVRRKWDVLGGLLIISALCILTWFYGMKVIYIRYWAFFFPLLMSAGGFAFAEVMGLEGRRFGKAFPFAVSVISGILCVVFFINGVAPKSDVRLPLTDKSRQEYLEKNVLGYSLIEKLNKMEPKPRVYFLYGATSRFYCDFFVIAGFTSPYNFDRFWEHASTGEKLHDWLKEIGITHLLVNEARMAPEGKRLPSDPTFSENFTLVDSEGKVKEYLVK